MYDSQSGPCFRVQDFKDMGNQSSPIEDEGGLWKIDCRLTVNVGGHTNAARPFGEIR